MFSFYDLDQTFNFIPLRRNRRLQQMVNDTNGIDGLELRSRYGGIPIGVEKNYGLEIASGR